jgi:microcompartment protein CcmK/EutM
MNLAKVVGTVVSSQKEASLTGLKFLLLEQLDERRQPTKTSVVAVDSVGAGVGELVLYASGSSARQTQVTDKRPVDAVVMAIVDSWEIGGEEIYRKGWDDEASR